MNIRPSIILGAVAVALLLIGVSFAVAMSRREKPPSPFVPDVERNAMKEIARDRERRIAEPEDSNRESPEQTNARLTREDAMIDRMAGDGTRQSVRHGDTRAVQPADAWSTPYDAGYGAYMPSVYAPFVDGPTAQGQQAADQQALNQQPNPPQPSAPQPNGVR